MPLVRIFSISTLFSSTLIFIIVLVSSSTISCLTRLPQNIKSTQPMNVLEYSYFKRGLLAAGSEDGYLRIWDTCASTTALQTFESAHFAPVGGIAFSPFNSQLMCSSGMDKRIVLYDVGKRS